jgi:hypothetical protein
MADPPRPIFLGLNPLGGSYRGGHKYYPLVDYLLLGKTNFLVRGVKPKTVTPLVFNFDPL